MRVFRFGAVAVRQSQRFVRWSGTSRDIWSESELKEDAVLDDIWAEGLPDNDSDLFAFNDVEDIPEDSLHGYYEEPASRSVVLVRSHTASLEQLPIEVMEHDIVDAVRRTSNGAIVPSQVSFFMTRKNSVKNALIQLDSDDSLNTFLTPNRLAFGLHILGQRCPAYNAADRIVQVRLRGLPRRTPIVAEMEQLLRDSLPSTLTVVDIRIPRRPENPEFHRGFATITFSSFDEARTAVEAIHQSQLNSRFLTAELEAGRPITVGSENKLNPYELMLHQVRERVQATEEENSRLRAALEKAGVKEQHE